MSCGDQPPSGPIASAHPPLGMFDGSGCVASGSSSKRVEGKSASASANGRGPATSGTRAPALFAGRGDDRTPVPQALVRAFALQPHLAAFAVHRHDAGDAQFGRLLQDQVHLRRGRCPGPARSAAVIRCAPRACLDFDFDRFPACRHDARVVVASVAVEQHAGVAGAEPQHRARGGGRAFGQGDARWPRAAFRRRSGSRTRWPRRSPRASPREQFQLRVVDAVRRHPVQHVAERAQHNAALQRGAIGAQARAQRGSSGVALSPPRVSSNATTMPAWRTSATMRQRGEAVARARPSSRRWRGCVRARRPVRRSRAKPARRAQASGIAGVAVRMQEGAFARIVEEAVTAPAWPAPPTAA